MNWAEMERAIKALQAERGAVFRWGHVVAVDEAAGQARVQLDDAQGLVSAPLRVLQRRTLEDQHQEMPDLGEPVACLFSGQGLEQGLILGAYYSTKVPSPCRPAPVWYRKFKDGTELEYDRVTHKLSGVVRGEVALEATDDVLVRSGKTLTLEGGEAIVLRTPSLSIQGMLGKVCSAVMNAAISLIGNLTQQGSHTLTGDVNAGGRVIDGGGNTNHHSH